MMITDTFLRSPSHFFSGCSKKIFLLLHFTGSLNIPSALFFFTELTHSIPKPPDA